MRNILLLSLCSLLGACASQVAQSNATPIELAREFVGAPRWVQSCGAFRARHLLCGVGSSAGTKNPSLARNAAITRGRAQIAENVTSAVKATAVGREAVVEDYVDARSKQLAEQAVIGSSLEDTWISPNGTMYALIIAPGYPLERAIQEDQALDPASRDAIRQRLFASLEAEFEEGAHP